MSDSGACLGISFAAHKLLYAVNIPDEKNRLAHVGCIDFNFDICAAITENHIQSIAAVENFLREVRNKYGCRTVRLLLPAIQECWSVLPRSVYEDSDERDAHLDILMNGSPAGNLQNTWFPMANQDYRFLLVRQNSMIKRFEKLFMDYPETELMSEFEIGSEWQLLTNTNGSFMTVNSQNNYISIASFLFGKLRGSTYFQYDSITDIPFLWKYHSRHLSWMDGIHDQILAYGNQAQKLLDIHSSIWFDTDEVVLMNTLNKMNVEADEETYSFDLENAFPAIIQSLNLQPV